MKDTLLQPNRNYRDTIFRMLFREKKELLFLFNAIHGTAYEDPEELVSSCKTLGEYVQYTERVRQYSKEQPLKEAVEKAVRECIEEDILADFLRKTRSRAKQPIPDHLQDASKGIVPGVD